VQTAVSCDGLYGFLKVGQNKAKYFLLSVKSMHVYIKYDERFEQPEINFGASCFYQSLIAALQK